MSRLKTIGQMLAVVGMVGFSGAALAHGDVTPQPVNTAGLKPLGEKWVDVNPYRGDQKAIKIGESAFAQNCARCHGLGAVSGGIAPDLRYLAVGPDGDEWFSYRVQNGSVRDGRVYMPKMFPSISQEGLWAIRSWLDTVHKDD